MATAQCAHTTLQSGGLQVLFCRGGHWIVASSLWHLISRPTRHRGLLAESWMVGYGQKAGRQGQEGGR